MTGEIQTMDANDDKNLDTVNDRIERWFREEFHREPIATNTEHFNHVRRAVDRLKSVLSIEGN